MSSSSSSDSPMDTADAENADIDELIVLGQALIDAILERKPHTHVQSLVDAGAPLWFQDDDGWSPLHAAAHVEDAGLMRVLLQEGALWNAVDNLGNTAADIALSLNNAACYRLVRDAGIRSELLLQLLSSRGGGGGGGDALVLKTEDATALASTDAFLRARLRYTTDAQGQEICLLAAGAAEVGVMMGWEREIMRESVRQMCVGREKRPAGLRVLNVGFGLGIVDSFFQALPTAPVLHVIIEPHPDVLRHMRDTGWYEKKGVRILEGKWQDFIGEGAGAGEGEGAGGGLLDAGGFDAVYTDTFSEDYDDLYRFFQQLPRLLAGPDARFSFFNGLGATNALFYDVYGHLAEMHLEEVGLEVRWDELDVAAARGEDRWGKTREYFGLRLYRLPIAQMRARPSVQDIKT